jgi:phospholipid/cholesterol/gamma-HCH transport system substrate-binding protein
METRASYVLVGGFVLTFLAGLIAFAIWIAKVDLDAEYRDYDIYFNGTVSGLYKRSIVYYLGIPVGDVRDINLSPEDPSKVKVWVRLRSEVPVSEESRAQLQFQGLTGVAYVELSGGSPTSPRLQAELGAERPVIATIPSPILELFDSAPNLLSESIKTLAQVQKLLSNQNIQHVVDVLDNTKRLTANLADGTDGLDLVMSDVKDILVQVKVTTAKINQLVDNGNMLLEGDAKRLVADASETMKAATAMLERVDGLVAANEESVTQFISGSLPEVSRMIMDLRLTARNLSRLVSRIEKNPTQAIFGAKEAPYNLQKRKTEEEGN